MPTLSPPRTPEIGIAGETVTCHRITMHYMEAIVLKLQTGRHHFLKNKTYSYSRMPTHLNVSTSGDFCIFCGKSRNCSCATVFSTCFHNLIYLNISFVSVYYMNNPFTDCRNILTPFRRTTFCHNAFQTIQ